MCHHWRSLMFEVVKRLVGVTWSFHILFKNHNITLYSINVYRLKIKKQTWWHTSVVPAIQESVARGSLEPKSVWVTQWEPVSKGKRLRMWYDKIKEERWCFVIHINCLFLPLLYPLFVCQLSYFPVSYFEKYSSRIEF